MTIKLFRRYTMLAFMTFGFLCSAAAQNIEDTPELNFSKLVIGPKISLVLEKGDNENLRFDFNGIDPGELHIEQTGNTLNLYLDKAKNFEKRRKYKSNHGYSSESWYGNDNVTAYVTYRSLKKLVIKGSEEVEVSDLLTADIFKLKVYGDVDLEFEEVVANKFKARMYGESRLRIADGVAQNQKYVLYGEHDIDAGNFSGTEAKATNFGESRITINSDYFTLNSLGEATVLPGQSTLVRKGFVIGETHMQNW